MTFQKDIERRVFTELSEVGSSYASVDELIDALRKVLTRYAKELPAIGFESIDMLIWGKRHGWVAVSEDGTSFRVQIPGEN